LEFYRLLRQALHGKPRTKVVTQIEDAARSVVLNVAEAHPAVGADRARRFRNAADEASECVGALDMLDVDRVLDPATLRGLAELLDRECAMLWRLSRPA
jgi:four helix bundle protein